MSQISFQKNCFNGLVTFAKRLFTKKLLHLNGYLYKDTYYSYKVFLSCPAYSFTTQAKTKCFLMLAINYKTKKNVKLVCNLWLKNNWPFVLLHLMESLFVFLLQWWIRMWFKSSAKSSPLSFCFNLKMETRFKITLKKWSRCFSKKSKKPLKSLFQINKNEVVMTPMFWFSTM
jgi:hypothetical protein